MPAKNKIMAALNSSTRYDIPTAITFLMAGLGIGSLLAIMLAHRLDLTVREESKMHSRRFGSAIVNTQT
jgi:hypothetical protein